ncbi:hypothetical protein H0H81_007280 [Sphagnurus paluster]|uniref:Uncharacterized protein n=1 Tax=Sphagnurus paluster TaxID=117069 RepID=A0A9P7FL35_9AGAR|nr:hypothetical protein H0H81_007280 [Sphagnurus paluster]
MHTLSMDPDAEDPLLRPEPDFESQDYLATRLIFTNGGLPADNITPILRQMWQAERQKDHDAWTAARALRDQEQAEAAAAAAAAAIQPEPPQPDPIPQTDTPLPSHKAAKTFERLGAFPEAILPPDEDLPTPSEYARERISKGYHVCLWYFSQEGCDDAFQNPGTVTTEEDIFGITIDAEKTVQLKSTAGSRPSPKAVDDNQLSWEQFTYAHRVYIRALEEVDWPQRHIKALSDFFAEIEHASTSRSYSLKPALLEYQHTVRKEWHQKLGSRYAFDISFINKARLDAIIDRMREQRTNEADRRQRDATVSSQPHITRSQS